MKYVFIWSQRFFSFRHFYISLDFLIYDVITFTTIMIRNILQNITRIAGGKDFKFGQCLDLGIRNIFVRKDLIYGSLNTSSSPFFIFQVGLFTPSNNKYDI